MKILYLITKSNWGGAQKYVYDLATSFSSKGHDVSVAFGGKGVLAEKLSEGDIQTLPVDSLVRDISLLKEVKSAYRLYRIITDTCPDVLHTNSTKAGGLGALIGRIAGIKNIVHTVHGAPFREDRPWPARQLIYFFTWVTCILSHKVIAVSNRDAHDIGRMLFMRKKVRTIYPGIMFDGSVNGRTQEKSHQYVDLLTVAELHANKGLIYALEAVNLLKKKGFMVRYTIFGEGEDRGKLERYIRDHQLEETVFLKGHNSHLEKEWPNYDIFILPSVKEGLPYVLIEAGKAMLPVVSSITGGIPEIVRHEETGLLIKPKDASGLAQEIERLILDKRFAKKLGIQLHSHVVQNFSHAKMIAQTAQIYGLLKSVSS